MFKDNLEKEIDSLLDNTVPIEVEEIENNLAVIFNQITSKNETSSQIKEAIFYILSELSDNVKQHSKASKCWILYKKDKRDIIILVADNGIGIPAAFEAHFPDLHENDLEKVREALEKGVSTKGEGRGYGLRTVRGIVNATVGKMIIISGGVGYKITGSKKDSLRFNTAGTMAIIKIPIDTVLESSQFYKIIEGRNERN